MKRYLFLFIITALALPVSAFSEQAQDNMWTRVAENNYIYKEGIVGTEDRYGFTFLLKSYNKGQYEPVNGNEILYTLSQYTLDCGKQMYKIGVIDSYGANGNFVNGDYNKYAEFQPVVSGTAVYNVYKNLCRP